MDETEVINILKQYSDKKIERVITFLVWSQLYIVKENIKHLEMCNIIITFPLQRHLAFLKDLLVVFILSSWLLYTS